MSRSTQISMMSLEISMQCFSDEHERLLLEKVYFSSIFSVFRYGCI